MKSMFVSFTLFVLAIAGFSAQAQQGPGRIQGPSGSQRAERTPFWIKKEDVPQAFIFFDDATGNDTRIDLELKIQDILKQNLCKGEKVEIRTMDFQTRREKIEQKPCNEFLFSRSNGVPRQDL